MDIGAPRSSFGSARGSPGFSSLRRTRGCSIRVGYRLGANGKFDLASFWGLHPQSVGALAIRSHHARRGADGMLRNGCRWRILSLTNRHETYGRTFVKAGVLVGVIAAVLQLVPTGDAQGKMVTENQPPTLAAMEGLFETQQGAPLAILGQPDVQNRKLDNPLVVPQMLSFLTYKNWSANVRGLDAFPRNRMARPDSAALLQLSRHGRPGDNLYCGDGRCRILVLARKIVHVALDAVDSDAQRPFALHREHRGLDPGLPSLDDSPGLSTE